MAGSNSLQDGSPAWLVLVYVCWAGAPFCAFIRSVGGSWPPNTDEFMHGCVIYERQAEDWPLSSFAGRNRRNFSVLLSLHFWMWKCLESEKVPDTVPDTFCELALPEQHPCVPDHAAGVAGHVGGGCMAHAFRFTQGAKLPQGFQDDQAGSSPHMLIWLLVTVSYTFAGSALRRGQDQLVKGEIFCLGGMVVQVAGDEQQRALVAATQHLGETLGKTRAAFQVAMTDRDPHDASFGSQPGE